MPTTNEFITYILENIEDAGVIAFKKMFGEYAVYCDGEVKR
jgi:TfoX/Sxy family transcriptional regulator of competence genes